MLGSWRAEGAWGGGCLRGVEGVDSGAGGWPSEAASGTLASLLASDFDGAAWGAERGVAVAAARASGAFLAVGFSGEVSSIFTLQQNRDSPAGRHAFNFKKEQDIAKPVHIAVLFEL